MSLAATIVVSSLPSAGQAGKFYLLDDGTKNSGKVYIYKDKWIEVTTQAVGLSAYQIALNNGYEGTEQEWLENEVYGDNIVSAETDSDGYFIVHTRQGKTIKTALKPLVDAKASADKAKISETNAKTSETNSANSAAAALASQEASANSQAKARISETNAKTSELNAKASENNAKTSETNAKNSATAAAGSASVATTQAENSSNSATASQKSATASADSASAAHASEVNASSSASAASASAVKAKTSETNAKASELNAKASENNAKSSEKLAKAWAMSESSPDGVDGNKSAKTWAMSAISAENNAKQSEINANSYKNAAASSATASANSASASSASEINSANSAKASASSAAAAKASEANAKASADRANSSLETVLGGQVNSDWAITDTTNKAFIKNKPDLTVYATKKELENGFTTASLTVSGETSVPTPSTTNNSKTIANTEFVHGVVSKLVNGAPTALDTLQELATALGNDPNFSTTILNKIGEKESKTDAQIEHKRLQDAIPTKVSQLSNDSGYLTEHQSLDGYVKTVNNTAPDSNGNVTIAISGGGGSDDYLPLTGGTVTGGITATNFQTGTATANYFQCRKFRGEGDANSYYHAIDFGYSGHDSVDFYEYDPNWNFYKCLTGTKSGAVLVGNINGNGWNGGARLTGAPTAPTATAGTNTTQIATTAFVQTAVGGKANTSDLADFVTTSGQNTWRAQQTFNLVTLGYEQYSAPYSSTNSVSPSTSAASYYATGAFTLNLSTLSALLGSNQSTVFTAYITAGGDYALSITNGGTVKYIGEASDVAITSAGLLLNILMTKDRYGSLTSIVQANKLT